LNNAPSTDTSAVPGKWILACLFLVALTTPAQAQEQAQQTWILVDTRRMTLSVMRGEQVRRTYANISIGRAGTSRDKRRHDETTPLGHFHISRIAATTPFHRFFGIDYPNMERAERALKAGVITGQQYIRIRDALRSHRTPPQETPLGGYIGIHGVGEGDPSIHEDFNWTNGCIALSNEQIDDLARWIRVGMVVVIR
jgi:murein L,D-transpeptidase YafK